MIIERTERESSVRGVRVMRLRHVKDAARGDLAVVEFSEALPFSPRRCFWTYSLPGGAVRGEHAHRECSQFMVCVRGSCRLRLDDGRMHEEVVLEEPQTGVLVPPMVWTAAYEHSADSVLMVLASHPYDAADYIRDYKDFLATPGLGSCRS